MVKELKKIAYVQYKKNGSIYPVRLLDDNLKIGQMVNVYIDEDGLEPKTFRIAKLIKFGIESWNVKYCAQAMIDTVHSFPDSKSKMKVVETLVTLRFNNRLFPGNVVVRKTYPINGFLSQEKIILYLLSKKFIKIDCMNKNYLSSYSKHNGIQRVVFSFRKGGVDFCVLNAESRFDVDFYNDIEFSVRYSYEFEMEKIHKIIISLCGVYERKNILNEQYFLQEGYFKINERFFSLSSNNYKLEREIKKSRVSCPIQRKKVIDIFENAQAYACPEGDGYLGEGLYAWDTWRNDWNR